MLPFYWNVEKVDEKYYTQLGVNTSNAVNTYNDYVRNSHQCNATDEGKIAIDAMVCTFRVYNGKYQQSDNKYVYELRVPCFTRGTDIQGDWQNSPLISKWITWNKNNFVKDGNANGGNTFRSYNILNNTREFAFRSSVFIIDNFGRTSTYGYINKGEWWVDSKSSIDAYGEYKLSLHSVEYLQCSNGRRKEQTPYPRVCDVNFSVTKPYILQKTPAGTVNITTQALDKFYMYADRTQVFSNILNAVLANNTYSPNAAVKSALDAFINKYSKLAVEVKGVNALFGTDSQTTVRKVPGKNIYFVDGNLTIDGYGYEYDPSKSEIIRPIGGNKEKYKHPFTIVQTIGHTTIVGNLDHNMMLLTNGNITFSGRLNCNDAQVVRGIFYAGGELKGEKVAKNDRLENSERCIGGNLHIKGIVIGQGLQNVANARRSELNQWFWSSASKSASLANRRNYIMNGAAVLIEYAPSVFTKSTMPPGAEEFTTALEVYRK
jgi:hypothetical protein